MKVKVESEKAGLTLNIQNGIQSHHFKNFPQFSVIHTVKGFGIVNTAEVDVSPELSHFFDI